MSFDKKVLSFFYVWYRNEFGPNADVIKGNWGGRHNYDTKWVERGRRNSTVPHAPLDGYYDSFADSTIKRQFWEHQYAEIDGMIISWWGFGSEDKKDTIAHENYSHFATKKLLSLCPENVKLTLYLETSQYGYDGREPIAVAVDDISRICKEYGSQDSWLKFDERPVVVVYGRVLGEFRKQYDNDIKAWRTVRDKLDESGIEPFLIGDSLDPKYYAVFDGLHTYNPIGTTVSRGIKTLREAYKRCADAAKEQDKLFAGTACPGYDDRKLKERDPGLLVMRKQGGYYEDTWEAVLDADADCAFICTYNEWWEGSTIESAVEWGYDYLDLTRQYGKRLKRT